jgi:hypothetical protein
MMNITKLREKYRDKKYKYIPPIDFNLLQKANWSWRTKFKLNTFCAVCGSTEKVESHHIQPIYHGQGKFVGYKGFEKLIASIGRKQITVCHICHVKITKGQYDGMSLSDLYDIRLIAPEGSIKLNKHFNNDTEEPLEENTLPQETCIVKINENNKTYFNSALEYYHNKKLNNSSDTSEEIAISYDDDGNLTPSDF